MDDCIERDISDCTFWLTAGKLAKTGGRGAQDREGYRESVLV